MKGSLSAPQEALRRAKARLHPGSSSGASPPVGRLEPDAERAPPGFSAPHTSTQPAAHGVPAMASCSAGCSPPALPRRDADGLVSERCGSAQSTGSTYGATASRGPSGSADGITQSSAPPPAAPRSPSTTPSRRASPSSNVPDAQPPAPDASDEAAGEVVVMPSWRVPSAGPDAPSMLPDAPLSPLASAPTRHSSPGQAAASPFSDSPDAHPPTPAPSPASHAAAHGEQPQRAPPPPAHVRFSVPAGDLELGRGPSAAPTAPPALVSAADQAAVALLRRLTYAEVQLAQLYVARGAGAAAVADCTSESAEAGSGVECAFDGATGEDEVEGQTGVWWDEVPATLDVTAALRSSRRLRAALADDTDAGVLDESSEQLSTVHTAEETCVGGADALGADSCESERDPHGAARDARGSSAPAPSGTATSSSGSPNVCADIEHWVCRDDAEAEQDALALSPITCASPATPPPGPSILLSPSPARRPTALPASWSTSPSLGKSRIAAAAQRWTLADFDVGRRIGQGRSGRVFMVREKRSNVVVALKVVAEDGARVQDGSAACVERAMRLQAMAGRQCPHIVRLYTSFSDDWRWYAVLEYVADGDLAAYLAAQPHRRLPEAQARPLVRHIACALAHLHRHGIVHRAVTARNVLLRRTEGDDSGGVQAKLGDFMAAVQLPNGACTRWAGRLDETVDPRGGGWLLDYAAPEVICGCGWSHKSDVWALGVLAFEMLCGYAPFDDVSPAGVKRLVCAGKPCFPPHGLSHTATSFLRALLRVEEPARCDAAAALAHPFLATEVAASVAGGAPLCGDVPPPVIRDLSETFSQVAASGTTGDGSGGSGVEAARATSGTATSEAGDRTSATETSPGTGTAVSSGASLGAAAFAVPFVHADESASVNTSLTTSSSPSSTTLSSNSAAANMQRRERTASLVSAAPSSLFVSSASPFIDFAFPTSPLADSTHGHAVPATPLFGAVVEAAVGAEEPEALPGRRASGSSLRSTGQVSRHTITPTLSDMSLSLLSVTRAPNAFASSGAVAAAQDDRTLRNPSRSNVSAAAAVGAGALQGCARRLSGSDAHELCSVSVSSLSCASPTAARGEWPAGDAAVSVSPSTSMASTRSSIDAADGHADHRVAVPLRFASGQSSAGPPSLLTRQPPPPARLDPLPTTAGGAAPRVAGVAVPAPQGPRKRKKPAKTPPCAVRLSFDALSDEDDGW